MARPRRRGLKAPSPSNTLQSKALASSTHAQCLSCPGADSNRYAFRHHPLKMACLPISPPGQLLFFVQPLPAANFRLQAVPLTGPTGLEPATSRVTVECSNQTELRPQLLSRGRKPLPHYTCFADWLSDSPHFKHSPKGNRTPLCTVKGCRPNR